ncbi:MAG: branched-chain amino acid ABC transporter permease [Alphaproteobacteria bacterium]|nr:branched-chain amino acid ABC transporter permease [Alphaproteobacteria bacterium]MBV8411200.1 branched-chain amino acid ABC transporter permease [Alphaproteobacteria bacterium]
MMRLPVALPMAVIASCAVFALALLLPAVVSGYGIRILNLALISAIAVIGLNFAFGYAGLITLAQAGFVGCGAYITAILSTMVGLSPWLSIPIAVVGTGVISLAIGLPILRLKGHYLALATLGFNVSFVIVATNWKSVMGGTDGISSIPPLALPGWPIANDHRYYYVVWFALALTSWCAWRIRVSHLGLAMIAVRDDEIATGAASVGVTRIKLQAFALSAIYAGLAGALFAHMANFVAPDDFALSHSIVYLAMLIIGGEGSIAGSITGSVIVTFMPELMRDLGTAYLIVFGGLMLVILIFLPKGLLSLVNLRLGRAGTLR